MLKSTLSALVWPFVMAAQFAAFVAFLGWIALGGAILTTAFVLPLLAGFGEGRWDIAALLFASGFAAALIWKAVSETAARLITR